MLTLDTWKLTLTRQSTYFVESDGSHKQDVHNKTTGKTEHVGVHHGNFVYDANGATPALINATHEHLKRKL